MPRTPRVHQPGGIYHAVLRGNHRQAIFASPDDYLHFEAILAAALGRYGAALFAHCWMTNHVHMGIRVAEAPLGEVMRVVASRYARWRQRAVPTTGHLFERRYWARLIDADRYLLSLVRYIHLNPVRAGLVRELAAYRWTSHHAYLGGSCPAWLQVGPVLEMLGASRDGSCESYRRLMGEEPSAAERVELGFGGRRGAPARSVGQPPPRAAPVVTHVPRDLGAIAADVAREHGIDMDQLQSRCRTPHLVRARLQVTCLALKENAANLSQVARYLGRSPSTLSDLLRRDRCRSQPKT